jgi:hypothetical protein
MIQVGDNGIVKIDILSNALKEEQIFEDYLDLEKKWALSDYISFFWDFFEFLSKNGVNLKETFADFKVLRFLQRNNYLDPIEQKTGGVDDEIENLFYEPPSGDPILDPDKNLVYYLGDAYQFPLGNLPNSFSMNSPKRTRVFEKIMEKVEIPFFDDFGKLKGTQQYALKGAVVFKGKHYYYCELKDNGKWVSFNKNLDGKEVEETENSDGLLKNNLVAHLKYIAIN